VVTDTIWDFLFLEGTVSIFRAAFAVLNILEKELLECQEFSEVYSVLNNQPFEVVDSPYIIILHMKKFVHIKEETINKLRAEFRPVITEEQRRIWHMNAKSKCPSEFESISSRRIKLLHKLPILDNHIRTQSKCNEDYIGQNDLELLDCKLISLLNFR
jgi:hypothetical protein